MLKTVVPGIWNFGIVLLPQTTMVGVMTITTQKLSGVCMLVVDIALEIKSESKLQNRKWCLKQKLVKENNGLSLKCRSPTSKQ